MHHRPEPRRHRRRPRLPPRPPPPTRRWTTWHRTTWHRTTAHRTLRPPPATRHWTPGPAPAARHGTTLHRAARRPGHPIDPYHPGSLRPRPCPGRLPPLPHPGSPGPRPQRQLHRPRLRPTRRALRPGPHHRVGQGRPDLRMQHGPSLSSPPQSQTSPRLAPRATGTRRPEMANPVRPHLRHQPHSLLTVAIYGTPQTPRITSVTVGSALATRTPKPGPDDRRGRGHQRQEATGSGLSPGEQGDVAWRQCALNAEDAPNVAPTGAKLAYLSLGVEHLVVRSPECWHPGPGCRPRGWRP